MKTPAAGVNVAAVASGHGPAGLDEGGERVSPRQRLDPPAPAAGTTQDRYTTEKELNHGDTDPTPHHR